MSKNLLILLILSISIYANSNIIYLTKKGNSTNDQIKINRALEKISNNNSYDTLYLKGPATYVIDEPIIIPSNVKLTGDKSVTLKLKDNLNWAKLKPMIGQKKAKKWTPFGTKGDSISNVEIYGFSISAGEQNAPEGSTYYPLIHFYNPKNISIHDMNLTNSKWDIIRLSYYDNYNRPNINVKIYNNYISHSGHEGIYVSNSKNFEIYNNKILHTRTNCGIRLEYTDNFKIYNNIIKNSLNKPPSGYAGICVNNRYAPILKAEIFNNEIKGKNGGIVLDGEDGKYKKGTRGGVYIHNNKLYNITAIKVGDKELSGAIRINGFDKTVIENNTIKDSQADGIIYEGSNNKGNNYTTIVRYNTIINNKRCGINNSDKSKHFHKFILQNNKIYGNKINYCNILQTNKQDYSK